MTTQWHDPSHGQTSRTAPQAVPAGIPAVTILGVPIAAITSAQALAAIEQLHDARRPAIVAFANAHTLNLAVDDPAYAALLRTCDLLCNDGSGVALAARIQGCDFPENLNGTDLCPKVLELARSKGWRTFFLGGRPGVADEASRRLVERLPGLDVVGVRHGYLTADELGEVIAEIAACDVDLLVVGMGNPVQERWLATHLETSGARVGLAVGAFLDFTAGAVPRAPAWIRRLGAEWLYRLYLEPGRLWRRYVVGNPRFLWRVAREHVGRKRGQQQ